MWLWKKVFIIVTIMFISISVFQVLLTIGLPLGEFTRGVFFYEVLNVFCDLHYFSMNIYWEAGFQSEWKSLLKIYHK